MKKVELLNLTKNSVTRCKGGEAVPAIQMEKRGGEPKRAKNMNALLQELESSVVSDEEVNAFRQSRQKAEEKLKTELAEEKFRACGIGKRFYACKVNSYTPTSTKQAKALAEIIAYIEGEGMEKGRGLILGGEPEGGKTHLLAAILHKAALDGMSVAYVPMKDFFLRLRSSMDGGGPSEREIISLYTEPQVLAIDDLDVFKSQHGEYQYDMLWLLLDKRYAERRSTLAATNLSIEELRKELDERTRRRLNAKVIYVPKTDWSKVK